MKIFKGNIAFLPELYPKRFILLFLFFFNYLITSGQATTNISGIVNSYFQVIEIIPAKACIRVADVTGLQVNARVFLVQMKGAGINTANNSSFGDTVSLNEAGNYEIGTICFIHDDSVFLFHTLLNTYNTASGKVQLVQFAEYYSADVTDTVKALAWNNTTGTGGVIAIYCEQDLLLHKPIYADSAGYRGGAYIVSSGTCSNFAPASGYVYNASSSSPQNGAYKGEGVADVTTAQSGGRGAPANGGGGGNNHNNGGGGGANLTAAGMGGGNSSTSGCTTTLRGLAGKALSSWNGQKIFSGGGGGAGHSNNGLSYVGGGNGGGIIFIWAVNLIGNGNTISANGGNGGNSLSDGAGGGGAGGSVIMHITNYTDAVSIESKGGNGGDSNDGGNIGRCYGAGGGGAGGTIYFTGAIPAVAISSTGGNAGNETGRDASCAAAQPAANGSNGLIFSGYNFARSLDPAGYCQLILPVKLVLFTATGWNKKVLLNWKIQNTGLLKAFAVERSADALQWQQIKIISAEEQATDYSAVDDTPYPGTTYYRIKMMERDHVFSYSPVRKVLLAAGKNFLVYPNPAKEMINILFAEIPYELKLSDYTGRVILQKTIFTSGQPIHLPGLQSGIYFISINGITQKLVIQ